MEKHVDEGATTVMEVPDLTSSQPEKKTPRRRLIQSTLFPHRSQKNEEEKNEDEEEKEEEEEEEEEEEDEDEEYCGSQSKNNRKRKGNGNGKGKGKSKAKRTLTCKIPTKGQDASSCRTENGNSSQPNGSEFFVKVSERKLQQKQQKEQGGPCVFEGNSESCTNLESTTGKRSRRQLKEKQQGGASPCKTLTPKKLKGPHCRRLMVSCDTDIANDVDSQLASEPAFDLRLEAKLAAEENARLFTGKQTHPFFSSWNKGKKLQGTAESSGLVNKPCSVVLEEDFIKPVHVFEILQDDTVLLDWSNWLFCNETVLGSSCAPQNACSSFFDDPILPLKIDHIHTIPDPNEASTLQNEASLNLSSSQVKNLYPNSETVSSANGQTSHHQLEYLQTADKSNMDMDTEPHDRFLQERASNYCSRGNQPDSNLWTDRYQPEKASEVCGNNESVRFVNEWLSSWCERYSQTRKNSTSGSKHVIEDVDYSWDGNDSDAESMDGRDNLKNVLLVTGPVGSGKSAAIYACAKEQGFQVIEVSASDWRNGAHMKQKFGAAMESLGLNTWSPRLRRKRILEFPSTQHDNLSIQDFDDVVEMVPTACKEQSENVERGSQDCLVKDSLPVCSRVANKTLILFEDVDIIFDEDRGFIATIQQIAETSKRPMILTSNSEDPVLPDQLDRLEVSFETPSSEELLSHVHKVCLAEKVDIQQQLLDRLIKCCQNDIRKTIMLLQFWCQGKISKKDRKLQFACGATQFDLDTGHWILPKVIPWGFPCQLSQLVEEEITKSLFMVKENASLLDVVEEEELGSQEMQVPLEMGIEAKKEAMLSRNHSIHDDNAIPTQFDDVAGFSNSSGSPVAFTRRTARRGPNTVLSSLSGEEFCIYSIPADLNILYGDVSNGIQPGDPPRILPGDPPRILPGDPPMSFVDKISVDDYPDPSTVQLCLSERKTSEQSLYKCSQMESDQQMCETYNYLDTSCVPESTFVPETEINNGVEMQSRTISCGHVTATLEAVSLTTVRSVESLSVMDAETLDKSVLELDRNPETMFRNHPDLAAELVHADEEIGDSHHEHSDTATREFQVMDECSRADFNVASISGVNPICMGQVSSVQERWKRLRSSRMDLKSYLTSEQKEASQIVKLTSKITDLISVADLMFGCCQPIIDDFLESSMVPSAEPNTFGWYDAQLEIASTTAEHGFCHFAKESTSRGSNSGLYSRVDLAREMLASTSNTAVLGKLVTQEVDVSQNSSARKGLDIGSPICDANLKRETEARLCNMIQNVVPSKVYLALRGASLHDYVSSLGKISKFEASRLSASVGNIKPRCRSRAARHYLSNGPLTLSHEDALFLAKHSCYGQIPLEAMEATHR